MNTLKTLGTKTALLLAIFWLAPTEASERVCWECTEDGEVCWWVPCPDSRRVQSRVSCKDKKYLGDYQLYITAVGKSSFDVTFVTDLDVPGGHYSRKKYLGRGALGTETTIDLYEGSIKKGRITGDFPNLDVFGINMTCS